MAAVLALLGGRATPALAHAVLESTTPADGEALAAAPEEISLRFSEPVAVAPDALRVHDSTGRQVPLRLAEDGRSEMVRGVLGEHLDLGSYVVTWRVTSADGHPLSGAFLFSVGDPEELDASLLRQLFAGGADRTAATAAAVVRGIVYLATLVAAGGVFFLAWVADRGDRRSLQRLPRWAALAGAVGALLAIPAQAAEAGGAGAVLRPDVLLDAATGAVGIQSLVQAGALAAVAVALRPARGHLPVAVAGAFGAAAALAIAGHTRTTDPLAVTVAADVVHVLAAAVWLGGLVLLTPAVHAQRRTGEPLAAARTVARFSMLATVALAAVTAAGVVLAWLLVRAWSALLTTAYGRILLLKVVLAAVVMALGAYNNRRLVPAVSAEAAPGRAWRRLRRIVRWEVVGLTGVVAVTAVLANAQPAAEAAGVTAPLTTTAAVGDDAQLSLTVDPNRAGYNEIHLYLLDGTGRPVDATDLELHMALPGEGIGPITRTPSRIAPGHWLHAGRELAVPGTWELEVVVGVSRFEQERATVTADVR